MSLVYACKKSGSCKSGVFISQRELVLFYLLDYSFILNAGRIRHSFIIFHHGFIIFVSIRYCTDAVLQCIFKMQVRMSEMIADIFHI